ncbi:MAG: CPXCG motif-containing cysteine-rich protein [Gammaproteobacteria bacterium]|nr:CPXCG motif-containing cysteine-rich protein [Gammaproteobacteria bacterium]NNF49289.1 CPXCG motif-containing cysteine-rich protein [Woeseiaceae bacterium]MBT8094817.1 CPXCG motif-containing cysteine-rich protein [Gammaproteobacteria bacterium]MBT8105007.1 CPXCG motif-containing cysteine-rich protein [Gammaproteobacteria bacterium]NNK25021.1 CPXCG motif-containing cysteine-rich protein [Woeseiaceae bacterium]
MHELAENFVSCPYCGERISVLVDTSVVQQRYVEDCEVCCRPIVFEVSIGIDEEITVRAGSENEV